MDKTIIQTAFETLFGKTAQIYGIHHIGGGEINQNYKILSDFGVFFVKVQKIDGLPKLFEKEQLALRIIRKTNSIAAVNPIGIVEVKNKKVFFLDFVESSPKSSNYWGDFGSAIAKMHQNSSNFFGFEEDNYLGTYLQKNKQANHWGSFFIKNRLMPAVKDAASKMLLGSNHLKSFEKFYELAEFIFTQEQPSLLHGNLWHHHVLTGLDGNAMLCNPSSYYGQREMDLAMTKMSSGFDKQFYEAYEAEFPLKADWEVRVDFCQMYYDLVNLNHYGLPYLSNIENRLNKWVK